MSEEIDSDGGLRSSRTDVQLPFIAALAGDEFAISDAHSAQRYAEVRVI